MVITALGLGAGDCVSSESVVAISPASGAGGLLRVIVGAGARESAWCFSCLCLCLLLLCLWGGGGGVSSSGAGAGVGVSIAGVGAGVGVLLSVKEKM